MAKDCDWRLRSGGRIGGLVGIAFSDKTGVRTTGARGAGAVMGNKKVKAIVIDLDKVPALHDVKRPTATSVNIRRSCVPIQ